MTTQTWAAPPAVALPPRREPLVVAAVAPLPTPGPAARTGAPREFSEFVALGAVATAVSTSLYNVLAFTSVFGEASLTRHPIAAFVLSNLAGMAVSFAGTRWWVFRDRRPAGPAGGVVGFVVINVLSWSVPLASLSFSRYVLDLSSPWADNIAANVVGLGLGTVVRFWALRASVFSARPAVSDVRAVERDVHRLWRRPAHPRALRTGHAQGVGGHRQGPVGVPVNQHLRLRLPARCVC